MSHTDAVPSLLTLAKAQLAAIGERVEPNEIAALDGSDDVDTERVPVRDDAVDTALDHLRESTIVSRDFREAGRGALWDRVRVYNPAVYGYPKNKQRGQARGVIAWEKITTIVLHTSGVNGLHPDRWLGVPTHVAIANDATVVLCHELNAYLWASHAANRYSCSLEIAGNQTITDAQVDSGRAALRYMVEELRARRVGPVYVAPHRFSHKSRPNDCGPAIWEKLGEWSMDALELQLGPVVGSGRPLPW